FNMVGDSHADLFASLNFANVSAITESIMDAFVAGEFDRVEVVYNQFKNAAIQFLTVEQLLPLLPANSNEVDLKSQNMDYIVEPSQEKIILELLPKAIKTQLYKAILDSHASE